ncbi:hypothetical protein GCM10010387_40690 [Streptomyces inusitatus]|uniref:Uncharacterized protein n=1 Tax=Streptomyces inusitatus TaxID=68221 RepID=A0A918QFZ7_9ACTN|nr:hypothetical protein [Streptomyces inusitatus]GGZ42272.1 hypothetical protein GCM10010387_40690 [Streptomyces inusitatus]
MSQQAELDTLRNRLDELAQRVEELERTVGRPPGRGDLPPVREAAGQTRQDRPELVTIPDTPYDTALWTDSDDEGLGVRDRHAP